MLVNKTVEFFLSEAASWTGDLRGQVADWSGMPAGAEAGTGTRCRRGPNHRAGSGLGAARDRTRYRRRPRLGPGQDAGGGRG